MTRQCEKSPTKQVISAAVLAALTLLWCVLPSAGRTQAVSLVTDGGLPIASGDFIAFDGVLLTLRTEHGFLSLRSEGLTCSGDGCPEPDHAPLYRVAIADDVDATLFPALIEAYARDQGFALTRQGAETVLSRNGSAVLRMALSSGPEPEVLDSFALVDADFMLISRDLGRAEVERFRQAGLGQLNSSRQSQFVALDALVPVVAARSDRPSTNIADLMDFLDGRRRAWPGDGEEISLHMLGAPQTGTEALIPALLAELGGTLTEGITWHDTAQGLLDAVEEDKAALGLVPASRLNTVREMPLTGPCGTVVQADRISIKSEDYPLVYPVNLYLPPWRLHPEGKAFLDWLRTGSAQAVVRRAGLADIAPVAIPVNRQGERLASAILSAGGDVPLNELQRMTRFLRSRERLTSTFRFEPGSTRLDSQSRESVLLIAEGIASGQFTGSEITLVGFSDGRGPADANRDLAFARAETVREAIISALGAAQPYNVSLATASFGEALPIACDDTPLGQRTNRRVEIWVRPQP